MFRPKDIALLFVIFSSMLMGILLPKPCAVFQPYPLYIMMLFLFLSLLSIRMDTIRQTLLENARSVSILILLKLLLLPVGVYLLFRVVFPSYAVAALLLTGISTGVVAPFVSNLLNGNSSLVLVMVVVSSLLAPFTLPFLVKILLGRSIEISMFSMMWMLGMVVFIPFLAVELLRRAAPGWIAKITEKQFPISLLLFALINLGVFPRHAEHFHQKPSIILVAALMACVLAGIYISVGIICQWKEKLEDQLAGAVSLGNMNNVLVIVFSSQFFGPLEPTLAAMYMIPFFGLILPLRSYSHWRKELSQRRLSKTR